MENPMVPSWASPLVDGVTVVTLTLLLWSLIPIPWRRGMWRAICWIADGGVDTWYAILGRERPVTPAERTRPDRSRPAADDQQSARGTSTRARVGYLPSRSRGVPTHAAGSHAFTTHSPHSDAESRSIPHSHSAFAVPPKPAESGAHDARLPQNVEELQKLARAITIHAKAPRGAKQRGIMEAWGIRPGAGPEWARASALFDLAVPRRADRTDPPQDDLLMEPIP